MSMPTMRTPRSPFRRSALRSAAVPGAPEAVTRTVMSRIEAAMLLGVYAVVNQFEHGVGIELEPQGGRERHAVGDNVDERDDVLEGDVRAKGAAGVQALQ